MSWFRRRKITLPEEPSNGEIRSIEALQESERKLREAKMTKLEVDKVTRKSRELVRKNDHFSDALQRAMRRTNG
jgi:hypothetical protein